MHRVFGLKEDVEYLHRKGAYLVPIEGTKVGVIKTSKGFFFLGGGIESNEDHISCLERECLEEAGLSVSVKRKVCSAETYTKHPEVGYFHPIQTYNIGQVVDKVSAQTEEDHLFLWVEYEDLKGNMFAKMQNWALEVCMGFQDSTDKYFNRKI